MDNYYLLNLARFNNRRVFIGNIGKLRGKLLDIIYDYGFKEIEFNKKGYAHILFESPEAARAAIKNLNGNTPSGINRELKLEKAKVRNKLPLKRKLFSSSNTICEIVYSNERGHLCRTLAKDICNILIDVGINSVKKSFEPSDYENLPIKARRNGRKYLIIINDDIKNDLSLYCFNKGPKSFTHSNSLTIGKIYDKLIRKNKKKSQNFNHHDQENLNNNNNNNNNNVYRDENSEKPKIQIQNPKSPRDNFDSFNFNTPELMTIAEKCK